MCIRDRYSSCSARLTRKQTLWAHQEDDDQHDEGNRLTGQHKAEIGDDERLNKTNEQGCSDGSQGVAKAAKNNDRKHLVGRDVTHRRVDRVVVNAEQHTRDSRQSIANNEYRADNIRRVDACLLYTSDAAD